VGSYLYEYLDPALHQSVQHKAAATHLDEQEDDENAAADHDDDCNRQASTSKEFEVEYK
jgi:hypothetical protein